MLVDIPSDIRPDLAERYRQMRPFDDAEVVLVRALVNRPDRLPRDQEVVLRQALNLARLWVISGRDGDCIIGPQLGELREKVRPLARSLVAAGSTLDPASLGEDAHTLKGILKQQKSDLLASTIGKLSPKELDRELSEKALVLAVGGGGGCGYVHLGTFSVLESLRLRPRLIAGSSIGSVLGLFRAREERFRDSTIRAVTHGLSFKKIFRILDAETRYAMPGTLRLYLRTSLGRFFVNDEGATMRIREMPVPFMCVVTGVRRELAAKRVQDYEKMFQQHLRKGSLARLLHLGELVKNMGGFLSELVATPGALRPIALGLDDTTKDFDVVDAVGFSSALPVIIQYDITRDDPRMHQMVQATLKTHEVDHLADGGLTANVPARFAWEYIQTGQLGTRNAFLLGLDCFAPQIGRNMMFLPLQRLAADNVTRDSAFTHMMFAYRRVLSATALVPKMRGIEAALKHGRQEFGREGPFLQKMLEPLPPI